MITDEMQSVNVAAIQCLQAISDVSLRIENEHVDLILLCIRDYTQFVRESGYLLISSLQFHFEGYKQAIEGLKEAFLDKILDADNILACLYHVGKRHPEFVRRTVTDLFQLDPRFLAQKKSYEENLLNISLVCGAQVTEIPSYVFEQVDRFKREKLDKIIDLLKT